MRNYSEITEDIIINSPVFDKEGDDKPLFDAIKNNDLIIFFGAGVSRIAGCSSWEDLAYKVIHSMRYAGIYNFSEASVLNEIAGKDARKAISICMRKRQIDEETIDEKVDSAIEKAFEKSLTPSKEDVFIKIHEEILDIKALAYITTNADRGIEKTKQYLNDEKKIESLDNYNLKDGNIFYLHGPYGKEKKFLDDIVFSVDQYLRFYEEKDVIDFLKIAFSKTVVFLGYGLEEYEILQNIFRAISSFSRKKSTHNHYLLSPVFAKDYARFKIESDYFKIFSVKSVPYFIDYDGYKKIFDVLKILHYFVEDYSKSFYEIDYNSLDTIDLIEKDSNLEDLFFKQCNNIDLLSQLNERGFFNPEKNPEPITSNGVTQFPFWNVLHYLEKITEKISLTEDNENILLLLNIIEKISEYRNSDGKPIDNCTTWCSFIHILSNIPNEYIKEKHLNYLSIWLDSQHKTDGQTFAIFDRLLPKFMNENASQEDIQKTEIILKNILKSKNSELLIENFCFDDLNKKAEWIAENFGTNFIQDILKNTIPDLLKWEIHANLCYYSFFEDCHYKHDDLEALTEFFKKLIPLKLKYDFENTNNIIKFLLTHESQKNYYMKLGLYCVAVSMNLKNLSELFWKIFSDPQNTDRILNAKWFKDELRHVLEKIDLNNKQRKFLCSRIEKGPAPKYLKTISSENLDEYLSLWKMERFQPFIDRYEEFGKRYTELKQQNENRDSILGPMLGKVEVRTGAGPSIKSKEDFDKMSGEEIAQILKRSDEITDFSVHGTSEVLRKIAEEIPVKFIDCPDSFLNCWYEYMCSVLVGIMDAWKKDSKMVDEKKFLSFIKKYIESESFWKNEFWLKGGWNYDFNEVLKVIGHIIQDAFSEKKSFDLCHIDDAENIVFKILQNCESNYPETIKKNVDFAFNTPAGDAFQAFIKIQLAKTRRNGFDPKNITDIKWNKSDKKMCDTFAEKFPVEFYTIFGIHIAQFFYIDHEYVKKIADKVLKDANNWNYFIEGYLWGSSVYTQLFSIMRPHYKKYIHKKISGSEFNDRVSHHVSILYLRGTDETLFRKLIDKNNYDATCKVIMYFDMQEKFIIKQSGSYEEGIKKVVCFIEYLIKNSEKYGQHSDDIVSETVRLLPYFRELSEKNIDILLKITSNVEKQHYGYKFIPELLRLFNNTQDKIKSAEYTARILIQFINSCPVPRFDTDQIREMVKEIYKIAEENKNDNLKKDADTICNLTVEKWKNFFLKDVWEEFHD